MVRGAPGEPAPTPHQPEIARSQPALIGRSLPPTPDTACELTPSSHSLARTRQHGHTISLGQLSSERGRQGLPLPRPPDLGSSAPQYHRPRAALLSSSYSDRPGFLRQMSEPLKYMQRSNTLHFSPTAADLSQHSDQSLGMSTLSISNGSSSSASVTGPTDHYELMAAPVTVGRQQAPSSKSECSHSGLASLFATDGYGTSPLYAQVEPAVVAQKEANRKAVIGDGTLLECCPLPSSFELTQPFLLQQEEQHCASDAIPITSSIRHVGNVTSRPLSNTDSSHSGVYSPGSARTSNDCDEMFYLETADTLSSEPQSCAKASASSQLYQNLPTADIQSVDSGYSESGTMARRNQALAPSPEITYGSLSFDRTDSQEVSIE